MVVVVAAAEGGASKVETPMDKMDKKTRDQDRLLRRLKKRFGRKGKGAGSGKVSGADN